MSQFIASWGVNGHPVALSIATTGAAQVVPTRPKTSGYKPSALNMASAWGFGVTGGFTLASVDEMRQDDQVMQCLRYVKAPLFAAEFDYFGDRQQAGVAKSIIDRFWQKSLLHALQNYEFGHSAAEVVYRYEGQAPTFSHLKPLHPKDVRPFSAAGRLAYIRVTNVQDANGEVRLYPATANQLTQGFWLTHDPVYSAFYGRSVLIPAWIYWRWKTIPNGAIEAYAKWAYKNAVSPTIWRHPDEIYEGGDNGATTIVQAQDLAREMAQKIISGSPVEMSSAVDPVSGKYLWDLQQWSEITGDGSGLEKWLDVLDKRIRRAIGIPDEIIDHDGATGGYSRSQVAVQAFFQQAQLSLGHIFEGVWDQLVQPELLFRFGSVRCKAKPKPLLPPDEPGDAGPGGKGAPRPPGQPDPAAAVMQKGMQKQGQAEAMAKPKVPAKLSLGETPLDSMDEEPIGDEPEPDFDWLNVVTKQAAHVRIVGPSGSGKSTLAQAIATQLPGKLVIIDPVWRPGNWGGLPAVTVSADQSYTAIDATLKGLLSEMKRRQSLLQQGVDDFEPLTIIFDEVPDTVSELPDTAGLFIRRMGQRGRHSKMRLIGIGQSDRVESWGIGGYGDVAESFTTIYLGSKALEKMPGLIGQQYVAVLEWLGELHPIDLSNVRTMAEHKIGEGRLAELPGVRMSMTAGETAAVSFYADLRERVKQLVEGEPPSVRMSTFKEEDHPRDVDGKFGEKNGSGKSSGSTATTDRPAPDKPVQSDHYKPNPTKPNPQTGVPDHARVGVPAMDVPPPPGIPRLPNLSKKQRKVESRYAEAYLADPDAMADKYLKALRKRKVGEYPNVFATDDVKMLNADWNPGKARLGDELPEESKKAMAKFNTAVHQTANAVTKRAFLKYLDDVVSKYPEGDPRRSVLATNGGCAAGKGSTLARSTQKDDPHFGMLPAAEQVGAIWDAAGEQNATENAWIYEECQKRGIKATFAYVWADPKDTWEGKDRGVIRRAKRKGRMVDARLFADSYALGAQNMKAFAERYKDKPGADFIFIDNRQKAAPKLLDRFPDETLQWDAEKIYANAVTSLKQHKGDLDKSLIKGGLAGTKIWGPPRGQEASLSLFSTEAVLSLATSGTQGGHWITLGGHHATTGSPGSGSTTGSSSGSAAETVKHHGVHVFIKDGRIEKGPGALKGKRLSDLPKKRGRWPAKKAEEEPKPKEASPPSDPTPMKPAPAKPPSPPAVSETTPPASEPKPVAEQKPRPGEKPVPVDFAKAQFIKNGMGAERAKAAVKGLIKVNEEQGNAAANREFQAINAALKSLNKGSDSESSEPSDLSESAAKSPPSHHEHDPEDLLEQAKHRSAERQSTAEKLRVSPISSQKRLGGGANESLVVTTADGGKGVFKPVDGEERGLRKGVKAGTYYRREVAASSVADILGFGDLVPVTVEREIDGRMGSVQNFIPGTEAYLADDPYDGEIDLARAAAFDFLIAHSDRHKKNWMVSGEGKLVLIDNGLAFPTKMVEGDYFNYKLMRRADKDGLRVPDFSGWEGKWPEVEKALAASGIEKKAIALTKDRFDLLVKAKGEGIADLIQNIPKLREGFNQHIRSSG